MAQLPIHRRGMLARRSEWDPFERMQEMLSTEPLEAFSRLLRQGPEGSGFTPAFEVKETKDGFIFKADLPGIDEKDLDVSVTGDRITVSGHRETEKQDESDRYYAFERSYGSFSRSFTLPEDVNTEGVQASLKDGVLTLNLPKKPEVKPRKIPIGAGRSEGKAKA